MRRPSVPILPHLPNPYYFLMKILVGGGAGYIGSHCVKQLVKAGHEPVVLDNLVLGHRGAVSNDIPFYQGDMGDESLVQPILEKEGIDIVMHSLRSRLWAKAFSSR